MKESLGKYLKSLRDTKKKTLRQVEAETGVSNAHLSQLENDSIKKPSSELLQKLSSYYGVDADAMKNLAGVESNTTEGIAKTIPGVLKILSANELVSFSDQKEAEGLLPQLIRELIFSSGDLEPVVMPVGESNFLRGWDGVVRCRDNFGCEYLPKGVSCWEMGKNKDVKGKAEDDYKKRTENSLGIDSSKATFVFVTLRRWERESKEKWISDKLAEKRWKDIQVIDAEDIEIWLERNSVIALSYARRMRFFPAISAEPIREFWDKWWRSTTPSIDEELILESGKRVVGIKEFLKSEDQQQLKIKSRDQELGIALFYANISKLEDEQLKESILSRTIIVSDPTTFDELITKSNRLILIPKCSGCALGAAKSKGHRVVIITSGFEVGDMEAIGRTSTEKISKHLMIENGMREDQASRIAKNSHGNISVLRMMLGDKDEISLPAWCKPEYGMDLAPLSLLGSWNANNAKDRELVEKVSGKSYLEVERLLTLVLASERPPLEKHGNSYLFFQEYSIAMLQQYLSIEKIIICLDSFVEVLSEVNTKYELEADKRFAASIYKKGVSYSELARKGSAVSLALLSSLVSTNSHDIQAIVRGKVKEIFKNKNDWVFWASLDECVMFLAEAAPEVFLTSLRSALNSKESDFSQYLAKSGSFMGGTEYAELLWALELCAWKPEHLFSVTRILMMLAAYEDKSSNVVNQPSNSLWEIFKIWDPQTTTTLDERLKILQKLESDFPQAVWKLLIRMIPGRHEFGHSTYRPRFSDIDKESMDRDMHKEAGTVLDEVVTRLEKNSHLWIDLFDEIFDLPAPSLQIRMLEKLIELPRDSLDEKQLSELWDKVEKKYADHLEFSDTGWSFKGKRLTLLKKAYENLSPLDLVTKWSRFFDYWVRHPLFAKEGRDYERHAELIRTHQQKIFKEIQSECGLDGIFRLINEAPNAFLLGELLAEVEADHHFFSSCINKLNQQSIIEKEVKFMQGYVFKSQVMRGVEATRKVYELLDSFLKSRKVEIITAIPFERKSWDFIENLGENISAEYWKLVPGRNYIENLDDAIFVSHKFLEAQRVMPAFHVLASMVSFAKNKDKEFSTDWAMTILDALLERGYEESDYWMGTSMFQHHLKEILKTLSKRNDLDRKRLAILEWHFLPLFKYHSSPENLIRAVNEEPELFVSMIKMAYKKDDKSHSEEEEETSQTAASYAYDFLREHKRLPGVKDDGSFDGVYFQSWANKVRQKSSELGRKDISEYVLGELIAYAPNDDLDNSWPHRSVRDLIEEFNSDRLDDGIRIGLFNKRGGTTKSLFEGGGQERQIARRFEEWEKSCSLLWTRTSSILREMKMRYLADANDEDQRAIYEEHKFNS